MPQRFTQSVRLVMIYTRNALLFLLVEQFILRAWMCLLSQSIMRLYTTIHRVWIVYARRVQAKTNISLHLGM